MDGMTEQQRKRAEEIRKLLNWENFSDSWHPFCFADAIVIMTDGMKSLRDPVAMKAFFDAAWNSYAAAWNNEHYAAVAAAIGGELMWERIKEHPNGRDAVGAILERINEKHGAVVPGLEVDVDVSDILIEHNIF